MIPISNIKNPVVRAACKAAQAKPGKRVSARALMRPTTDENGLNRTEAAWLKVLIAMDFLVIRTQSMTLKLADDTRYTPDFQTTSHDGAVTFWEVKGFFRDDAKVKIKVAARQFTEFKFILVFKKGAGWITEEVKP